MVPSKEDVEAKYPRGWEKRMIPGDNVPECWLFVYIPSELEVADMKNDIKTITVTKIEKHIGVSPKRPEMRVLIYFDLKEYDDCGVADESWLAKGPNLTDGEVEEEIEYIGQHERALPGSMVIVRIPAEE